MKKITAPINLQEQSENVRNLHQALEAFGFSVAPEEKDRQHAGDSTINLVRTLQRQFNIQIHDRVLIDQPTADHMNRFLRERGLLDEDRPSKFKVSGKVFNEFRQAISDKTIIAFDVDLRGAAIYDSVESLRRLEENNGFEGLGKAVTNRDGYYEIFFEAGQFTKAEKELADIVAYLVEDDFISGRSALATKKDYFNGWEVRNLHVFAKGKVRQSKSEYTKLMEEVSDLLRQSELNLFQLDDTTEQVKFLATETHQPLERILLLVKADKLRESQREQQLSHELLYGLGRQDILMSWFAFATITEEKIIDAIKRSMQFNIISSFDDGVVREFVHKLHEVATVRMLDDPSTGDRQPLAAVLALSLHERGLQTGFIQAYRNFTGSPEQFWNEFLPQQPGFVNNPDLIFSLQFTNQLILITGNHFPLIQELQQAQNIKNTRELLNISLEEWKAIIDRTGLPKNITGEPTVEKKGQYIEFIRGLLNAALPTEKISLMLRRDELKYNDVHVKESLAAFFERAKEFDFSTSRVENFDDVIRSVSNGNFKEVKNELHTLQRLYQISPTPEAMSKLRANGFTSARQISNIPEGSFKLMYSKELSEPIVSSIYARASYHASQAENISMTLYEMTNGLGMGFDTYEPNKSKLEEVIKKHIPNYEELFGNADICECEHCRSVYSPVAYFVDILRFLEKSAKNPGNKSPLDMLLVRRPDLQHIPLTCENTNTIIPYIDLVNEILEFYTVHNKLDKDAAYDTGETTAAELRANPQYTMIAAYKILKDAIYPFTLPYHQPLDTMRKYFEHLGTNRYELMQALRNDALPEKHTAICSESLLLSQEEYEILTAKNFKGDPITKDLWLYYGYASENEWRASIFQVPNFLQQTGVAYTDLVELIKTRFINPHQFVLDYLQDMFTGSGISASDIYTKLIQIKAGTLDPSTDVDLMKVLNAKNLLATDFSQWVNTNVVKFQDVITLYEPASKCDLANTRLRSVKSIYENLQMPGIGDPPLSNLHRFIRLWRKTGWTIPELDQAIIALGETDITPALMVKLSFVKFIQSNLKIELRQLLTLWGNIDTYGKKSLYAKLFLNKAVQKIDEVFKEDKFGNYLDSPSPILIKDHIPAILAAFRLNDEGFESILADSKIDIVSANLTLENLSIIYRYVVLSKALKVTVSDLCLLKQIFEIDPFSKWDPSQKKFINIEPKLTFEFVNTIQKFKSSGFKVQNLNYLLNGVSSPESNIAVPEDKIRLTIRAIREGLQKVEQDHPDSDMLNLTEELLRAKMQILFSADVAAQFFSMINGDAVYTSMAEKNLAIDVPPLFKEKTSYQKGSGRLQHKGVLTDGDKTTLENLAGATPGYKKALQDIYNQPEQFIKDNFTGTFGSDTIEAIKKLIDHPAQLTTLTLPEKWTVFYKAFLPFLKKQLKKNIVVQHLAIMIGLDEQTMQIVLDSKVEEIVKMLSETGLSAKYFKDMGFTLPGLERVDPVIDFKWNGNAPDSTISSDQFSVRWEGWICPGQSDDYSLIAEVQEADESLKLWIDDQLAFEKTPGDPMLSWESIANLTGGKMHKLKLEYAENIHDAGVKLSWQTASHPKEVLPTDICYPDVAIQKFTTLANQFHRAALFINGFKMTTAEVEHLKKFPANFANIDFVSLTQSHWIRTADYILLRNELPKAYCTLIDVFNETNKIKPVPAIDVIIEKTVLATGWNKTYLDNLTKHFNFTIDDFKNEIGLNRISKVMKLARKTESSVASLAKWSEVETQFEKLDTIAQDIKNTVKAKYEEPDWLEVAKSLSDKIRGNQKNALIAYLLTDQNLRNWGVSDANSMYEYFLIDVQMEPAMDTSRIKQAISAVQMFIQRCLLNLESERNNSNQEIGVSPGYIDTGRWEWMKNYRVWEANRKVFLYPENWLEPEWRDNKSYFFKELEGELLQNDITDQSVENAFRNYLFKLNEVANMHVCGMYQDMETQVLHVFARTHTEPYRYYYRTRTKYKHWTAWEKVSVDIKPVKFNRDGKDYSGIHLIPVVWKKRLFLFWPEFMEKAEQTASSGDTAENDAKTKTMNSFDPKKHWEVNIAWTEYKEGKWSPKQLSKEMIIPGNIMETKDWDVYYVFMKAMFEEALKNYRFEAYVDGSNRLNIRLLLNNQDDHGRFRLPDIQSKITIDYTQGSWFNVLNYMNPPSNGGDSSNLGGLGIETALDMATIFTAMNPTQYKTNFMAFELFDVLKLKGNTYFKEPIDHNLLYTHQISTSSFENSLGYPFFYFDNERTYFLTPEDITYLVPSVKSPEKQPFIPFDELNGKYLVERFPMKPPKVGPDDLHPDPINEHLFADTLSTSPFMNTSAAFNAASTAAYRVGTIPMSGNFEMSSSKAMDMSSPMKSVATSKSAFGGISIYDNLIGKITLDTIHDKGLRVYTFFHPYSSDFITRLNEDGIGGLQDADTSFNDDKGDSFEQKYDPNVALGFVQSPLPAINVDFDEYGAYSIYNWELFFHTPLFIATRLSKNGKYAEAMKWFHYIFDPTTNEVPDATNPNARYWKVLPFKTVPEESLENYLRNLSTNEDPVAKAKLIDLINNWKDNPFKPHLIARSRPIAYMKNVVIKYIENLTTWADELFRRDTMESINEATQLYVISAHLLKYRPQFVPKRGNIKSETYHSLQPKLDEFSNALVQFENIFPYSSEITFTNSNTPSNLLGMGSALYFCIPNNEKILKCWDTVADRLFKIRHCMNIDGVERKLALFEPPIDPGMLVQAAAKGLSLGSVLADLNSPAPFYRFNFLLQKALEFCNEVKSLGTGLLSAIEKKDAEELSRKRATHEFKLLELMTAYKEKQILEAKANKQILEKTREATVKRLQYYLDLLGKTDYAIPGVPAQLPADSNKDTFLPDTTVTDIKADVDGGLVDVEERGLKVIGKEKNELEKIEIAFDYQQAANVAEGVGSILSIIPNISFDGKFLGIGAGFSFGGSNLGSAASATAKAFSFISNINSFHSTQSSRLASYIRREQEWTSQATFAARELPQIDKQILAADIRIQLVQKDLDSHKLQIENATEIEQFLQGKFTNTEMYQWMKDQLFFVYKQAYQMAYDMAKKAEKAYRFEIGKPDTNFIQFGYWDSSYQGLTAGEKLDLSLRQMEKSYLEDNKREFELTRHVSIATLNPYALLKLKQTGSCEIELPEELFDLDYPGHYFRRIKSVSISIPCITGAYTTINCTLRMLKNSIRINTANGDNGYEHNHDDGLPVDDERFVENNIPFKAIATSSGQNDNGVFELNFRDERYLPFEGAGVITTWKLECNGKYIIDGKLVDLSQFTYDSISDVILHIHYTSREDAGKFRQDSIKHLDDFMLKAIDNAPEPFVRLFSLKQDFPDAFHQLMNPGEGNQQSIEISIGKNQFNRLFASRNINTVETVVVLEPKEGKTITSPVSFTIDNVAAGSWLGIFNSEMKKTTIALGEYDPIKKITIKATGMLPTDSGLKKEEIDDLMILMYFRVVT